MCCTVIEGGRAERQRRGWIEAGRFDLEVLKPRRLNFAVSERAKLLLDAFGHEGFFGRCQTFSLPAPTKMLQPRLDHCFSSRLMVRPAASRKLQRLWLRRLVSHQA